ncbi:MAG: division/cell wall cluster transcriptional repressor MraZ [Thermoleophilia bacterium]
MQQVRLYGAYEHTLDAKNRVAVPARLRAAFVADGVVVTQGLEPCLSGYTPEGFDAYMERRSEEISELNSKGRDLKRLMTASAMHQTLDSQGRITLPTSQLEYAGIEREVTIIGVHDHFEIWDRATWNERRERMEREANATADELATS